MPHFSCKQYRQYQQYQAYPPLFDKAVKRLKDQSNIVTTNTLLVHFVAQDNDHHCYWCRLGTAVSRDHMWRRQYTRDGHYWARCDRYTVAEEQVVPHELMWYRTPNKKQVYTISRLIIRG